MKLLFVADYLPLQAPVAFRIHDFARFLTPMGVSINVVSRVNLTNILKIKASEYYGAIRVFRAPSLDVRLSEAVIDIFQIASTFLLTLAVALQQGVNLVVISVPPGVPGIGAFFASKMLRRKIAFDVRDKWEDYSITSSKYRIVRFTNRRLKELYNFLLRKADVVFGVTPSIIQDLKGRGAPKVVSIPNGVDLNLFHPRAPGERSSLRSKFGFETDDIILVYTGGIGGYYRPEVVIQAMRKLSDNGRFMKLKFLLVGGGEKNAIEKILEQVKLFKLENSVVFYGKKSREFVASLLPACDLGVVPFDDNPLWICAQPTKFFEYCAVALPSIVSVPENSDLGQLVRNHKVGYVIEPMNVADLESALKDFCHKSEARREEMGLRARRMVELSFDRQKLAKLLLQNLEGLQSD